MSNDLYSITSFDQMNQDKEKKESYIIWACFHHSTG